MRYFLIMGVFLTSCATSQGDWSELMRRDDLVRESKQDFITNMGTATITYQDIKRAIRTIF